MRQLFRSVGAAEPEWGGVAMERALFYEAVTRARRRLVLCRQVTDSSGTPLGASPFWEELRDLYRAPEAEAEADVVDGADGHRTLLEAGLGVSGGPGGREALRRAAASARRAPRQDTLTDPHVLARLASQEVYSASEIESYLQCPFRWFVEKQLRAEPLDLAVDALTRGTVVHAALRDLYERLPAEAGAVRVT
ncbi:MAG: PD-(D/E)XK nuclease family protein, partial [Actinobacteria bacterium]